MRASRRLFLAPLALLGAGLVVPGWLRAPEQAAVPSVQAASVDDPKLTRTVKTFDDEARSHKHPTRLVPVGHPGMRVRIELPEPAFQRIRAARGGNRANPAKFEYADVLLGFGDAPLFHALLRVRGVSSADWDRKSFNVNLLSSQQLTPSVKARKLFLLNLAYDPHGFKMRFSYRILSELGLFPAYSELAVVDINGRPQGLYLLVERPEDAIRRTRPGVVSIHRVRKRGVLEAKFEAAGVDRQSILDDLVAAQRMRDPAAQLAAYERVLELDAYLTWMAFNSLVQNADSADEIFLYEHRPALQRPGRLSLMAWDYDDLQREPPPVYDVLEDPLTWAAGYAIDRNVISNPGLYARYRLVLEQLLRDRLTEAYLVRHLDEAIAEVDGVDTQLPAAAQLRAREQRAAASRSFREQLLTRRTLLLERLRTSV